MRARLALTLLVLTLAACEPAVTDQPPGGTWQTTTLTAEGTDRYLLAGDPNFTTATAALTNTGGNTRTIAVWPTAPATVDQSVCATFTGSTLPFAQQGVVLRFDGTHAVTITKNVYGAAFWAVNVHQWDLNLPVGNGRYIYAGGWTLPGLGYPNAPSPLPWRMCATATGPTVSFKVWPLSRQEPPVDDPCCTGALPLNVWPGRPGVYLGHIQPGHTIAYSDIGWSS